HHERQPAVSLQRVRVVAVNDRPSFPVLEPEVSWHPRIVLVGLAVALLPVEKLAARDAEPGTELLCGLLGLARPFQYEIDHGVSRIVGNPGAFQGCPSAFFRSTYSAEISAMIASFLASFASRAAIFFSSSCSRA